jgi:hypothetical protein
MQLLVVIELDVVMVGDTNTLPLEVAVVLAVTLFESKDLPLALTD